ncbi:hypothetical protein D7Z94_21175 [Ulvibacterium marinum]|uniref:Phage holin family protein n=1 Tax=Ulvibacterium marinum TaxID=2419782 RepID=A0A3B0C339_9FLAO|nr:hypothetical protein D7Z94_21175 [Ulvibacterium marinum]
MGVIDSLKQTSSKAMDTGETYLKKTQEYYTLKAFQQLAFSASLLSKLLLVCSLVFLGFIFLVVGGVIALGEHLNSLPLACLVIGFVLIVIAVIVFFFRKHIDTAVIRKLSKEFFN